MFFSLLSFAVVFVDKIVIIIAKGKYFFYELTLFKYT
jgi:hypothetical protein